MHIWKQASLVLALLVLPTLASAETVYRMGNSVSLDADQIVNGDYYGSAGTISLSGEIKGDAALVGGQVTANGVIAGDLLALTGSAQVHASVTDDVRIVAGEVTIAEYVGGDVFVIGGILTILSTATVEGNIFFFGGEGEINGVVGGSVYGWSEVLRLDGPVGGDVDVTVGRSLVLGERADLAGNVTYQSSSDLVRASNAVVVGDIVKNTPTAASRDIKDVLIPMLVYAFAVLFVFIVLRHKVIPLLEQSARSFTHNGLIGLAGLFLIPAVLVMLLATVIASLISIVGLLLYLTLHLLAGILVSFLVGYLAQKYVGKVLGDLQLIWLVVGIVGVMVITLIPFIGPACLLVLVVVMSGTLLRAGYYRLVS